MVISIIALLIALLLPALGEARAAARKTVCLSQLRQIQTIEVLYTQEYRNFIPPGFRGGNSWWDPAVSSFGRDIMLVNPWSVLLNKPGEFLVDCPSSNWSHAGAGAFRIEYGRTRGAGEFNDWLIPTPRMDSIVKPARKVSLGDVQPWWPLINGTAVSWRLSGQDGFVPQSHAQYWANAVAWVHEDRANFSFFDGHARSVAPGEPEDLWFWPVRP